MNFALPQIDLPGFACGMQAVVAIPAKDEAAWLPACLRALSLQVDSFGRLLRPGAFGVMVYANNCSDGSADVARCALVGQPFPLRVIEARLAPGDAHAGGARRRAMDLAAAWLREGGASDGVILTTDADSQVPPTWICANLEAISEGADAVLGRLALDEEGDRLPAHLQMRGRVEGAYDSLLTELSAWLDPQEWNPWPHHSTISGASVAVTRRMYMSVGGLPEIALGEEKAFVARLRQHDARIRFAPDICVVTSARLTGRAIGGVADTLRIRGENPAVPCDESLEPCATAFKRALWRGRLRRGGTEFDGRWREALRLSREVGDDAVAPSTFGSFWHAIEQASPVLTRKRLAPADLPRQTRRLDRLLNRLRNLLPPLQDVEAVFRPPLTPDNFDIVPQLVNE